MFEMSIISPFERGVDQNKLSLVLLEHSGVLLSTPAQVY
jgi:hypothetical protein